MFFCKAEHSSASLDINPSGGLTLESVRFGFPYRIVVVPLPYGALSVLCDKMYYYTD
ncbi:MAG: hypothetical protein QF907_05210 [Nitrospinota bacterium]|nr:hypothetical protein [Nitrospinota bacterium]HJN03072.1 hypothetical protein [Nitrospinota bacterium]